MTEATDTKRAELIWVPIDKILPNHLNPRKDAMVHSQELQRILEVRGWEEGLTVYRKGAYYVLMSGHRRWHSARAMGMKEVPIYIVEAPKSDQEEVERIASLQLAHKEWTVYEWAKFTYDSWVYWGKPTFSKFSTIINLSKGRIAEYINVFEYYPRDEIEDKLEKGIYGIRTLALLVKWMDAFRDYQPQLLHGMTESMVRRAMLKKAERKRLNPDSFKGDRFVQMATPDQMREFLITPDMSLKQAQETIGVENLTRTGYWQSTVHKISHVMRDIPTIKPRDREQAENMAKHLDRLIAEAIKKKEELVTMYADNQLSVDYDNTDKQTVFSQEQLSKMNESHMSGFIEEDSEPKLEGTGVETKQEEDEKEEITN